MHFGIIGSCELIAILIDLSCLNSRAQLEQRASGRLCRLREQLGGQPTDAHVGRPGAGRVLQQDVHVARGKGPRDAGECETELGRDGVFRLNGVPETVPVHFRGDVRAALRHSLRAAQLDSLGGNNGWTVTGAAAEDRTVERAGHRAVRVRQADAVQEVSEGWTEEDFDGRIGGSKSFSDSVSMAIVFVAGLCNKLKPLLSFVELELNRLSKICHRHSFSVSHVGTGIVSLFISFQSMGSGKRGRGP